MDPRTSTPADARTGQKRRHVAPDVIRLVYRFRFDGGTKSEFEILLDAKTAELRNTPQGAAPDWTELSYYQCEHCPLASTVERCPVAVNLAGLIEAFRDFNSYEKCIVEVETAERTYIKRTTVQKGLSALIGISMVTSNCPILDQLRPMVRFHLPFATPSETIYKRVVDNAKTYFRPPRRSTGRGKRRWAMKNRAYDLTTYVFQKDEPLLLDTNVWLYLYPAPSDRPTGHAAGYSAALKSMLAAGSRLVMDAMILSEYLNRYCRIEWNALHKAAQPDFKTFRKSASFLTIGKGAATFACGMLKLCTRHDHPFATTDVTRALADFEAGTNDFNDGLLVETCRHHGWKLVTNDSDFTTGGIEIRDFASDTTEGLRGTWSSFQGPPSSSRSWPSTSSATACVTAFDPKLRGTNI